MKRSSFTLILILLAMNSQVFAQQFTDATTTAGLNFTLTLGNLFDEVDNHPEPNAARRELLRVLWKNMGNGAAVGDYDRDGDLDVYLLAQLGQSNKLFRNNLDLGQKTFTDVTASPLDDTGMSRTAQFADLNNDGWLDLVLLNDDQRNGDGTSDYPTSKIFRNNGDGTFADVTAGSGFDPVGYIHSGCALADYDRDGKVDIYTAVWAGGGTNSVVPRTFPGENQLFRNKGNFTFEDVSTTTGVDGLDRDSFTPIFTDFSNNSWPDLYVAVDHTSDEFYESDFPGSSTFTDAVESTIGLDHIGNDMGVAVADFDNDDDLDLYATNIKDPDDDWGSSPRSNALHINQLDSLAAVSFNDEAATRNVDGTRWGWGTTFADIENDTDLDLIAVTGFDAYAGSVETDNATLPCEVCDTESYVFLNNGSGSFSRATGAGLTGTFDQGWDSRALIAFDYDRDGDQDFLITNVAEPVKLIENTTPSGHYLTVLPEPYAKAVGAKVYAMIGATEHRRDIIPGRSYLSGFPAEANFGLGSATEVDLRVVWPDGCTTTQNNVGVDQKININQLVLDFISANTLAFEEDAPVVLQATGSDCHGADRNADIDWSETTVGNVLAEGPSLDASGRSAGDHPLMVSLVDAAGAITTIPFTLTIEPATPPSPESASVVRTPASGPGVAAKLSLNTDEAATCRFSTDPATAFAAMSNTFDTTGAMIHETVIPGLAPGTTHSFYIRCADAFDHANDEDLNLDFLVPSEIFADDLESGSPLNWTDQVGLDP